MSRVYSTEPTPSASVTLATSHGPIEIDLWRRECPNACDTFLRLAADGYYDGLVFHRVVANQLVQTGRRRPDNNDDDQFSRYFSERLPANRDHLETPSRIKFDRRGRVAWARTVGVANNDVDADVDLALRGQFFVTLVDAPWLDGRHCAFGTVRGATIFNALRVGRTAEGHDENENDEAHADDAATLRRVVLGEGTTDVEKSDPAAVPWSREKEAPKKKRRRKGTKNLNVLSFGDEELAYDRAVNVADEAGFKSRHDQPDDHHDHHLRKETDEKVAALVDKGGDDDDDEAAKKPRTKNEAKNNEEAEGGGNERPPTNSEDGASETTKPTRVSPAAADEETPATIAPPPTAPPSSSAKREPNNKTDDRPPRSEVEARRARFLSKTKRKENSKTKGSEDDTLARLAAFRERLVRAKRSGRRAAPKDDDDDDGDGDWMATRFECRRHPDDEVDAVDDYVVVDERSERSNADGRNQQRRRRRRR